LSLSVGTPNFTIQLFMLTETGAIKIKRGTRSEKPWDYLVRFECMYLLLFSLFVVLYYQPTAGICVSWQRRSAAVGGKVSETRIKERRRERAARSAVGVQLSPLKSGSTLRSCRSSTHLLLRPDASDASGVNTLFSTRVETAASDASRIFSPRPV